MEIISGIMTVAIINFLGVVSPGPNFTLIVKNSITKSRQYALYTAIGMSAALLLQISSCILGLNVLIAKSPKVLSIIKIIGGFYLLYLGFQSIKAAYVLHKKNYHKNHNKEKPLWHGFTEGFLCNFLNVSAILFVFFLFTTVIEPNTSIHVKTIYGFIMFLIDFSWYSSLAFLISIPRFKKKLSNVQNYINLLFGVVLIAFGLIILIK